MYTLKGIFPEPKKEQKKNFIRENMKQLKFIQGKSPKETRISFKNGPHLPNAGTTERPLGQAKSISSDKSGKVTLNVGKTCLMARKKHSEVKIRKGDMAEFLKRKELRQVKATEGSNEEDANSTDSSGRLRDIGCQTTESSIPQTTTENTQLTMLYPKKNDEDADAKLKASGDMGHHPKAAIPSQRTPRHSKAGDDIEMERNRSRLNAILERDQRKDSNTNSTKDPYLPAGYQKGVLPKYLREKKEQGPKETEGLKADDLQAPCPAGHVTLPDTERKETLRMLRNSFAELVGELNKLPVKTDTLRMRNRKMELEKQLAKLEEGIKVFSRPRVFVKIGE